jgi:acetyl-CoA acetyltransferase
MASLAKTAIVGVGTTPHGELPGMSPDEIAVMAAADALKDAGIDKSEIDGLVTCKPPIGMYGAGTDENMAQLLGLSPGFSSTLDYGACGFSLHLACMAIEAGLANNVLLTFGTNGRSAKQNFGVPVGAGADWNGMHGLAHVAGPASMALRRHMALYGTTEEQFGWIAVSQREWATNNPRAVFREPLSIEQYLASPYLAAPLRRADLTMISDGGVAIVVTRADRTEHFAGAAVFVLGMAQGSGMRGDLDQDRLQRPWIETIARKLYSRTGVGAGDVDLAYLQDATSVWVLQQLEYFGFCGLGEGGAYVAEGHIRPGGDLPVNTGGGQLSESYMWNWLNLYEAVMQLRKACGPRQVPNKAEIALHSQTHDFWKGAATILSSHDGS